MKYRLSYNGDDVAEVEITKSSVSDAAIKDMVEFWSNWERLLGECGGDYTLCWLRKLTRFILIYGRPPHDEEGWYNLDGSKDINIVSLARWEFDDYGIDVEEIS